MLPYFKKNFREPYYMSWDIAAEGVNTRYRADASGGGGASPNWRLAPLRDWKPLNDWMAWPWCRAELRRRWPACWGWREWKTAMAIDPVVINHLRHHLPIIAMPHTHHPGGRHRVGPGGQPPLMCYLTPRASCPWHMTPVCLGLTYRMI
jgi:hypothetical protein